MSNQSYHKSPTDSQFANVPTDRLYELRQRYEKILDAPPPEITILAVPDARSSRLVQRLAETLHELDVALVQRTMGGAR